MISKSGCVVRRNAIILMSIHIPLHHKASIDAMLLAKKWTDELFRGSLYFEGMAVKMI